MVLSFEIGTCHLCRNENGTETPCYTVTRDYEDRCKHPAVSPFSYEDRSQMVWWRHFTGRHLRRKLPILWRYVMERPKNMFRCCLNKMNNAENVWIQEEAASDCLFGDSQPSQTMTRHNYAIFFNCYYFFFYFVDWESVKPSTVISDLELAHQHRFALFRAEELPQKTNKQSWILKRLIN